MLGSPPDSTRLVVDPRYMDEESKKSSRKRMVMRYMTEAMDSKEESLKLVADILCFLLEKTSSWSNEAHTEDTFAHLCLTLFLDSVATMYFCPNGKPEVGCQ